MWTKSLVLSAAVLAANTTSAEFNATEVAGRFAGQGEYHLALFNGDTRDGYMRLGWYTEGDNLVVYDRTMMPSAEIYETLMATMSARDLAPRSVSIRFHQGTAILNIDARLADGEISGQRVVQRIAQGDEPTDISLEYPAGTLLRAVTFLLPLVLDGDPDQTITYSWFAPLAGTVAAVTLSSSDGGEVETPAGTFDTTRWELRGGTPENDIYVTRGENPRIVRIDVLGQPLQFLAVESKQE